MCFFHDDLRGGGIVTRINALHMITSLSGGMIRKSHSFKPYMLLEANLANAKIIQKPEK